MNSVSTETVEPIEDILGVYAATSRLRAGTDLLTQLDDARSDLVGNEELSRTFARSLTHGIYHVACAILGESNHILDGGITPRNTIIVPHVGSGTPFDKRLDAVTDSSTWRVRHEVAVRL